MDTNSRADDDLKPVFPYRNDKINSVHMTRSSCSVRTILGIARHGRAGDVAGTRVRSENLIARGHCPAHEWKCERVVFDVARGERDVVHEDECGLAADLESVGHGHLNAE